MTLLHNHRWCWQTLQLGFIHLQHGGPQTHQVTDRGQLDQGNAVCTVSLQLIGKDPPQHIPAEGKIEVPGQHPQTGQGLINRPLPTHVGKGPVIVETTVPIFEGVGLLLKGNNRTRAFHPFRIEDGTGFGRIPN